MTDTERAQTFVATPVDILGIQAGDTVEAVRALLEAKYSNGVGKAGDDSLREFEEAIASAFSKTGFGLGVRAVESGYAVNVDGVHVQSSPFVTELRGYAERDGYYDRISVYFSSPLTGNRVVAVKRELKFLVSATTALPEKSDMAASLVEKYGSPTFRSSSELAWEYIETNDGRLQVNPKNCKSGLNICARTDYQLGTFDVYQKLLRRGVKFATDAVLIAPRTDHNVVGTLKIGFMDIEATVASLAQTFDLLEAKGKEAALANKKAAPAVRF